MYPFDVCPVCFVFSVSGLFLMGGDQDIIGSLMVILSLVNRKTCCDVFDVTLRKIQEASFAFVCSMCVVTDRMNVLTVCLSDRS